MLESLNLCRKLVSDPIAHKVMVFRLHITTTDHPFLLPSPTLPGKRLLVSFLQYIQKSFEKVTPSIFNGCEDTFQTTENAFSPDGRSCGALSWRDCKVTCLYLPNCVAFDFDPGSLNVKCWIHVAGQNAPRVLRAYGVSHNVRLPCGSEGKTSFETNGRTQLQDVHFSVHMGEKKLL